ncbi:hypothetical protein VL20_1901 [Microcystis panniformis FACHB-1757]|uniref:Uncharacterized protein n=1 Tax=Microcystis panniformis FACHB-1757 TaxID=1638788 RepID=A0A0K1RYR0_9CHRO|nr:hypothetical protein VL20_1901 [Microcystis panniformis FACHB-1757]
MWLFWLAFFILVEKSGLLETRDKLNLWGDAQSHHTSSV